MFRRLKNNAAIALLLGMTAALILLFSPKLFPPAETNIRALEASANKAYAGLEKKMDAMLREATLLRSDSSIQAFLVHKGLKQYGISFFFYENGMPAYWSDNETDLSPLKPDSLESGTPVNLKNGAYVFYKKQQETRTLAGLLLVKRNYSYQNEYLVNEFNPHLELPAHAEISEGNAGTHFTIKNPNGRDLFRIKLTETTVQPGMVLALWQAVAIAFLLVAIALIQQLLFRKNAFLAATYILSLFLLRYLMIDGHWPSALYETLFFSPQLYASSFWFNSPGDLLLNVLLVLMLCHGFCRHRYSIRLHPGSTGIALAFLVFYLGLSVLLNSLVSGLILNSRISFDASNLFSLDYFTLAGVLIIAIVLFSYFFFAKGLMSMLKRMNITQRQFLFLYGGASVFCWYMVRLIQANTSLTLHYSWVDFAFATALLLLQALPKQEKNQTLNFLLLNILLFSLYSAAVIQVYTREKEMEGRKVLASKLETNQDSVAEYLFDDVQRKISADVMLKRILQTGATVQQQVSRRVSRLYLSGYWKRYETSITALRRDGEPSDSLSGWTFAKALQFIKDNGEATSNNYLYAVTRESGRLSYVSMIPILNGDSLLGHVLIRLDEKLMQVAEGLPELFISSKVSFNKQAGNYSFARYSHGRLIYQQGDFSYFFSVHSFPVKPLQGEHALVNLDAYNHLVYGISPGNFLVISRPNDNPLLFFTLFSYLAALFSLAVFTYYALTKLRSRNFDLSLSFKRRIQVSVLALVVLSILLIGGETIYFLVNRYDESQAVQIKSRVNSLSLSLENIMKRHPTQNMPDDETRIALGQAASMQNTDFNLFSLHGILLYSSQPKIFEQGIISPFMDPEALFEIRDKGRTGFVQPENIGRLNYIAAYEPLRDDKGQIFAYLDLPYFEKQNERNKEISSFLSTLINTYVLLLALSVFVTLLIASRITEPLRLIQEKLGTIRLGKHSEHLSWNKQDEIGELITEYNRMVDELVVSADKLARSERESAWKEMARQVAHEIKNPLTPMKLSVQHLQKAWKDDDPKKHELLERISKTLIEQIDSLSAIASAFADFAQMPADRKEKVSLNDVARAVLDLFRDTEGITLELSMPDYECFTFSDRDQLLRLFSNLVKNSIQAIPSGRAGKIEIRITSQDGSYLVEFMDNGSGIPKELITKIFTPNFTTKSSGMGLGLAMAKRISENCGGKIWFETEENSGSIFYVSLPKFTAQPLA